MMEQNSVKYLEWDERKRLAGDTFCKQMSLLFAPHVAIKASPEAMAMYLSEVAEAICSQLPAKLTGEQMTELLRVMWKSIIADKQTSRYWFALPLVIKHARLASRGHTKAANAFDRYITKQEQAELDSKSRDKQNLNWTLAGAEKALADTERMIATGELPAGIGNILAQIPRAEIERRRARESSDAIPTLDDL
jgi:hypothetical protein